MILFSMVIGSVFVWFDRCLRYMLARTGVPSPSPPSATGLNLRKGTHNLLWGRSPHLEEARSGFREGERASEGRGCLERGTLNADRKANRKGAALFNGLTHGR